MRTGGVAAWSIMAVLAPEAVFGQDSEHTPRLSRRDWARGVRRDRCRLPRVGLRGGRLARARDGRRQTLRKGQWQSEITPPPDSSSPVQYRQHDQACVQNCGLRGFGNGGSKQRDARRCIAPREIEALQVLRVRRAHYLRRVPSALMNEACRANTISNDWWYS